MARQSRIYLPDVSLHVINRGVNRAKTFTENVDYEWFLLFLEGAADRHRAAVHAYALMPNHFHLVVTPTSAEALPRTMKEVGHRYARYYNRKYNRIGTLWNGRYRAIPILDERYWLTCLRYVEQNPVRAALVGEPGDYAWSTYGMHALGRPPGWVVLHATYLALGACPKERQDAYRAICGTSVSEAETVRLQDVRVGLGSDPNLTPVRPQSDPTPTPSLASASPASPQAAAPMPPPRNRS
jgi:putative transposase